MSKDRDPVRRNNDGSIDFNFYRASAHELRRQTRNRVIVSAIRPALAYFKFPQKRWMRQQASSRSSVLVA
jgi:hypothetical protein